MLARQSRYSVAIGLPGLGLMLGVLAAGALMGFKPPDEASLTQRVLGWTFFAGMTMAFTGLGFFAKAKGHSGFLALGGFFGYLGFLSVVSLKDRNPQEGGAMPGSRASRLSVLLGVMSSMPMFGIAFGLVGLIFGFVGLGRAGSRGTRAAAVAGLVTCFTFGAMSALITYVIFDSVAKERRGRVHAMETRSAQASHPH